MNDDPRTIFKLRVTRKTREIGFIVGLLLGLCLALVVVSAFQIYLCKREHPRLGVLECLRPIARSR